MTRTSALLTFFFCAVTVAAQDAAAHLDYRVLATTRTGTMSKEMNQAAAAGFVFGGVMGGNTEFGGKEEVVIMKKNLVASKPARREYKLLATTRTGTMQKELQQAGEQGFVYCGMSVFDSGLAGREVSVILERDPEAPARRIEYRLLATSRTGTMQKELQQAGDEGFVFRGMAVGKTAMGGAEVVSILERPLK